MFGFTHDRNNSLSVIIGEALNGEINARKSACSENGNSNGYHMPEPIKLKYVC